MEDEERRPEVRGPVGRPEATWMADEVHIGQYEATEREGARPAEDRVEGRQVAHEVSGGCVEAALPAAGRGIGRRIIGPPQWGQRRRSVPVSARSASRKSCGVCEGLDSVGLETPSNRRAVASLVARLPAAIRP